MQAAQLPQLRLVVLDGTWRKSRKMLYLNPLLQALPRLPLVDLPALQYRIRKAQQAHQLSSFEASVAAWRSCTRWVGAPADGLQAVFRAWAGGAIRRRTAALKVAHKKSRLVQGGFWAHQGFAALGLFAGHFHVHFDHHIGVQSHVHSSGRDGFDRAIGHAHLGFGHGEASFGQCFSDVGVGDGAKQAAIDAGFLRQLDGVTADFRLRPGRRPAFERLCFSSSARLALNSALAASVARRALPVGIRKLRA